MPNFLGRQNDSLRQIIYVTNWDHKIHVFSKSGPLISSIDSASIWEVISGMVNKSQMTDLIADVIVDSWSIMSVPIENYKW